MIIRPFLNIKWYKHCLPDKLVSLDQDIFHFRSQCQALHSLVAGIAQKTEHLAMAYALYH
jgi:hypothetical protein